MQRAAQRHVDLSREVTPRDRLEALACVAVEAEVAERVVHDGGDRGAEPLSRGRDHVVHRLTVCHVGLERDRKVSEPIGQGLGRSSAPIIIDDDTGSLACKSGRDRRPQTPARARDEHDLFGNR